jgi:hypothetical protein
MEPSVLTPQLCSLPELMDWNVPLGEVARPQQATDPSLFSPQVWIEPALMDVNEPPGGVA